MAAVPCCSLAARLLPRTQSQASQVPPPGKKSRGKHSPALPPSGTWLVQPFLCYNRLTLAQVSAAGGLTTSPEQPRLVAGSGRSCSMIYTAPSFWAGKSRKERSQHPRAHLRLLSDSSACFYPPFTVCPRLGGRKWRLKEVNRAYIARTPNRNGCQTYTLSARYGDPGKNLLPATYSSCGALLPAKNFRYLQHALIWHFLS